MWRLLLLLILVATTHTADEVDDTITVVVDGEEIEGEEAALDALGIWGLNLVVDSDKAVDAYQPQSIGIKAKDITKTETLSLGALGYVLKYGYLEVATEKTEQELLESDNLLDDVQLRKAVRKFQEFNGISPADGRPTPETLLKMSKSRCGVKDMEFDPTKSRTKRYHTSRNKWEKHLLTYWWDPEGWTGDMDKDLTRNEFEIALQIWADAGHVSFREVETIEEADIKIGFYYGDHDDGHPFSGPGWELAHAFYPRKGLLHFDDAEPFTAFTVNGINFRAVALHELGHILGIKHSDASLEDSVMYAIYKGYTDDLKLHEDDINAVVDRMGEGSGNVFPLGTATEEPQPATEIPDTPPECITEIDAAFHYDDSNPYVYVFAGAWYYRLKPKRPSRKYNLPLLDTASEPKRIGIDGFMNMPRKIDAAIALLEDANTFLVFKGQTYLQYDIRTQKVVKNGTLSDLWNTDTPSKIDAALRIDYKTLGFLSGDRLYKYSNDEWIVGQPGSNYFKDKYSGLNSATITFYKEWIWIFQGSWYSVVRGTNGKASKNYKLRLIKNDIKLPMCQESAGSLNAKTTKMCKKQLRKVKNKKGFVPDPACRDYIAEKYKGEVEFDENDFED